MYAMVQASGRPSGLVDWNNNYADDPDKCVLFHCSNFPQEFFGNKGVMDYQEIIAGTVGRENTYGTMAGRSRAHGFHVLQGDHGRPCRRVRAYVGEGEITEDPLTTFGGYAVARIPRLQGLLRHICSRGFEHHVAINPSRIASVIEEAFSRYLGGMSTIMTVRRGRRPRVGSAGSRRNGSGGCPGRARSRRAGKPMQGGKNGATHHRDRLRHGFRPRNGDRRGKRNRAGECRVVVQEMGRRGNTATRRATCSASTRGTTSKAWKLS